MNRKGGVFWWLVLILIIVFLFFFGARIYYYVNFLLGNDVTVRLDSNKESLTLGHGETQSINTDMWVEMNFFCSAKCSYSLYDLSQNTLVETGDFTTKPVVKTKKEFSFTGKTSGIGQDLYRLDLECTAIKNYICDARTEPTRRSLLIVAENDFNDGEKAILNRTKNELKSWNSEIETIETNTLAFEGALKLMNITEFNLEMQNIKKEVNNSYLQIESLNLAYKQADFNLILAQEKNTDLQISKTRILYNNFENEIIKKSVSGDVEPLVRLNVEYDSLCQIYEDCKEHLSINEIAGETEFNSTEICNSVNDFKKYLLDLNDSINGKFNSEKYNLSDDFWKDMHAKLISIKANISKRSLKELNGTNLEIEKILSSYPEVNSDDYAQDLRYALVSQMITDYSPECNGGFYKKILEIKNSTQINSTRIFSVAEQERTCCFMNNCTACCLENFCSNYPVIFLHGHDFSSSTPAEYSWNIFNAMQKKLGAEGFVDAGTISVSSLSDYNALKKSPFMFTFRGTYYLDAFKESSGFIPVQTKKENLDNYALRLNDLVKQVKEISGREKVILVTHSMGGLVARRYMQIFGSDDVDKLIMITAPNHGISGTVSTSCSIFGESNECSDMDSESLFMNKLDNGALPEIKIYNIVGQGCTNDGQNSDGVVTVESATLPESENVKNYLINGTCTTIEPLHSFVTNPDLYPQVYEIVKNSISN